MIIALRPELLRCAVLSPMPKGYQSWGVLSREKLYFRGEPKSGITSH